MTTVTLIPAPHHVNADRFAEITQAIVLAYRNQDPSAENSAIADLCRLMKVKVNAKGVAAIRPFLLAIYAANGIK